MKDFFTSKCCNEEAQVVFSDFPDFVGSNLKEQEVGTCSFRCSKCGKPCDIIPLEKIIKTTKGPKIQKSRVGGKGVPKKQAEDLCDSNDMWILLLATIRYSFDRRTCMSSLSGDLVVRYQKHLTIFQLEQIVEEIEKELHFAEARGTTLGMDIDHKAWQKNVEKIKNVIKHRKETYTWFFEGG